MYCFINQVIGKIHSFIFLAENAFTAVGKVLQTRRKRELYESLNYFTDTNKDPASEDAQLATKLNENQRHHKKINEILDRFVHRQEMPKMALDEVEEEDEDEEREGKNDHQSQIKTNKQRAEIKKDELFKRKNCERITAETTNEHLDLSGKEKDQFMIKKKPQILEDEEEEEVAIIEERNTSLSKGKTKLNEEMNHSKQPIRNEDNTENYKSNINRVMMPISSCDKMDDNINPPSPSYNYRNHHCNGTGIDVIIDDYNCNQQNSKNEPITIDLSESNINIGTTLSESNLIMPLSNNSEKINTLENNEISSLKIVSVTSLNECWNSTTLTRNNTLDNIFDSHKSISKGTKKSSEEIVISDEEL